jgi:hypothetical protein
MRTDIFMDAFGGTRKRYSIASARAAWSASGRGGLKMCSVCRDLPPPGTRLIDTITSRKLCPECMQRKGRVTKTCETHREYNNAHQRAEYADQREKGLCVWGRCPVETEKVLCEKHEAKMAAYKAKKSGMRWAA